MEENPKIFCPHCGGENEQKSKFCINCGIQIPEAETDLTESKVSFEPGVIMTNISQIPGEASTTDNSSEPKQQEGLNLESGQPIYQQQPAAAGSNGIGFSIASMVCGIVALLSCCIPCISIVVAIVGIVLGIISLTNKYDGRGMAIAGVIMGIIFLVLCVVMTLLLCFSSIMETLISEY